MQKIILDTDIGSDIDDAVALAYLLKQPQCDLLGITTVSGEPEKRAALASAICYAGGRTNIPIHVGCEDPLWHTIYQPKCPQYAALETGQFKFDAYKKQNTAIDFLSETLRKYPGEITLLTIGPLTNIATLLAIDPEALSFAKDWMIMGGMFFPVSREWNIMLDPQAAAKSFAINNIKTTMVGLDVTTKCEMHADECRTRFTKAGGPLSPVAAMAEVWFKQRPEITFHDPLAAALLFAPTLCGMKHGTVTVTTEGKNDEMGATHFTESAGNHIVAETVDSAAFFDHYFGIVGG
jgi:purine nucleosidase